MKETKKHPRLKLLLKSFIVLFIILSLILLYSYFIGTKGLKIKEYKITNENFPSEFYGLKIVHISDIHYGKHFNKTRLENVVNKINEINPDIVVLTGDLLDSKLSDEKVNELTEILQKINTNIGKYAIKGNHDYKHKIWENIIKTSGFINLNDTYNIIYGKKSQIMISGISTNLYGNKKVAEKLKSSIDYTQNNKVDYKILLMHEPDYINEIKDITYDLILAGHSHNGQVRIPFIGAIYKPIGAKKYYKNSYIINDSELFISSGLGTSVLNLRLFNKPSINFYRIVNK